MFVHIDATSSPRGGRHAHRRDAGMNRGDVVHLDAASAAVLGQPDRAITYEDSIALLTAAAVQRTEALQQLVAMQREFRTSLGG
jgi:hypothetical protein